MPSFNPSVSTASDPDIPSAKLAVNAKLALVTCTAAICVELLTVPVGNLSTTCCELLTTDNESI